MVDASVANFFFFVERSRVDESAVGALKDLPQKSLVSEIPGEECGILQRREFAGDERGGMLVGNMGSDRITDR